MPGFEYSVGSKWHPNQIRAWEKHFSQYIRPVEGISGRQCQGLNKNVSYTLQYLQFLAQLNVDLDLPEVLYMLNCKAFVVHGCAVVEALFYYVIGASGARPSTKFGKLCDQINKQQLINVEPSFYGQLHELRKLRNRVHIHDLENATDTDYVKFGFREFELMKRILKTLLTSNLFPKTDKSLDLTFLDPTPSRNGFICLK